MPDEASHQRHCRHLFGYSLGILNLKPAEGCGQSLLTPLIHSDYTPPLKAKTVIDPAPSFDNAIRITLAHRNQLSQPLYNSKMSNSCTRAAAVCHAPLPRLSGRAIKWSLVACRVRIMLWVTESPIGIQTDVIKRH